MNASILQQILHLHVGKIWFSGETVHTLTTIIPMPVCYVDSIHVWSYLKYFDINKSTHVFLQVKRKPCTKK